MNTTLPDNKKVTLEDITRRKEEVRKEITAQNKVIVSSVRNIFAPEPTDSSTSSLMRSFNTGMVIFDGVMTGIKIMRKIRAFFRRMK